MRVLSSDIIEFREVLEAAIVVGICLCCLAVPRPALADHKVYSPNIEAGENELEFRGHHDFDRDDAIDGSQKWKITLGRGMMSRWFTEAVFEWEKSPGSSNDLVAVEWENIIQLTEPGRHWADWGVLATYVNERETGSNDKLEFGPLMAKEIGKRLLHANVIFERHLGARAASDIEVTYAWELRWRGNERFEPGIQAYGELGALQDLDWSSEHLLGPAFFGKMPTSFGKAVKYDAALLFGLTDASPAATVRFQIEFEF